MQRTHDDDDEHFLTIKITASEYEVKQAPYFLHQQKAHVFTHNDYNILLKENGTVQQTDK